MQSTGSSSSQRKITLLLSILLNGLLLVAAALVLRHPDALVALKARWTTHNGASKYVTTAHAVRTPLFQALPAQKGGTPLLFLGDSHIEYCPWDELLQTPALNRGVAGDTVADVLERLDSVVSQKPKTIVLMVGTNDALQGTGLNDFVSTYEKLLAGIHQQLPGTVVYMETIPPVMKAGDMARSVGKMRIDSLNPSIRSMNDKLRTFADGKTVRLLDSYADLLGNDELRPKYTVDGVHLSAAGYAVLKQKMAALVQQPSL